MSPPYPNREDGSCSNGTEPAKKPSSWFSSWFENDNSDFKQQIHHKLNEFDDYQQRYERHNPFFWGMHNNSRQHQQQQQQPTSSLQQEMEEFFESAGFGGLNHSPMWAANGNVSTTSSSVRTHGGQYQMMRKEDPNGVQIDVQFPRKIDPESVSVEVLQEAPCMVQWTNQASSKDGRDFQDRARLGESIDCSKLSASISSARNALTIKAPTFATKQAGGQEKPRSVPVTERDE